jgi:hypothetical protein
LEGLRRVLETIRLIQNRFHSCSAGNLNVLLTLVEDRTTLSRQIQSQIRAIFGSLVFQTVIHHDVRLCEAPSAGESILDYAPRSRGALEYRALAAEIVGRVPAVAPPEGAAAGRRSSRRGIQKDLSELFGGLRSWTGAVSGRQAPTEPEPPRANAADAEETDNEIAAGTHAPASGPGAPDDLSLAAEERLKPEPNPPERPPGRSGKRSRRRNTLAQP